MEKPLHPQSSGGMIPLLFQQDQEREKERASRMKDLHQELAAAASEVGMLHIGDALIDPSEVIGVAARESRENTYDITLSIMLRGGAVIEQTMPPMEEFKKLLTALKGRQNPNHASKVRGT